MDEMSPAASSWGFEIPPHHPERDEGVHMASVVVNGENREVPDGQRNLLSFIRFDLGLTGTKYACGEGECGACTVLVDGEPVKTCMEHASLVEGKQVVTIEGLAQGGRLHPLQEAFIEETAMQC